MVADSTTDVVRSPVAIAIRAGQPRPDINSEDALRQAILDANAAQVAEYRAGKQKVFGFLVGQLMKEMRGKANAELANKILRDLLEV